MNVDRIRQALLDLKAYGVGGHLCDYGINEQDVIDVIDGPRKANEWQPIETAPEDGTPILIADIDDGVVYDVLNGHFEVLSEDEDDGPWDIQGGEPLCSYIGREAGIYFCCWLSGKEWESRWKFGPNSGYTHWMPLPAPPTDRRTPEQAE